MSSGHQPHSAMGWLNNRLPLSSRLRCDKLMNKLLENKQVIDIGYFDDSDALFEFTDDKDFDDYVVSYMSHYEDGEYISRGGGVQGESWLYARPANMWQHHHGEEIPVPPGLLLDTKLRDNSILTGIDPYKISTKRWEWDYGQKRSMMKDIIAFNNIDTQLGYIWPHEKRDFCDEQEALDTATNVSEHFDVDIDRLREALSLKTKKVDRPCDRSISKKGERYQVILNVSDDSKHVRFDLTVKESNVSRSNIDFQWFPSDIKSSIELECMKHNESAFDFSLKLLQRTMAVGQPDKVAGHYIFFTDKTNPELEVAITTSIVNTLDKISRGTS